MSVKKTQSKYICQLCLWNKHRQIIIVNYVSEKKTDKAYLSIMAMEKT